MLDKIRAIIGFICLIGALALFAGTFLPTNYAIADVYDNCIENMCSGYKLCCNGVCYDPFTQYCDCDGIVQDQP